MAGGAGRLRLPRAIRVSRARTGGGPGEEGGEPLAPGNPLRPGIPLLKQIAPLSSEHVHYY